MLARDIVASVDVPGFDRANVDGFALIASDTFGASEEQPRTVLLNDEVLAPGVVPATTVVARRATPIATGGMLPRGADAVLMVEHSDVVTSAEGAALQIRRPVTPGESVSYAGTDIARGETVLRAGTPLTSREIGVVAALGIAELAVYRRPRVAIFSTGNEIVAPGSPLRPGIRRSSICTPVVSGGGSSDNIADKDVRVAAKSHGSVEGRCGITTASSGS